MIVAKDIAQQVGVSRQAVMSVLNGTRLGCVSQAKRERILQIARENHYQPNFAARTLSSGRSHTIGLLMPWLDTVGTSPTFGLFLQCLADALERQGYALSLQPVPNESSGVISEGVTRILQAGRMDGFLTRGVFLSPKAVSIVNQFKIPAVSFAMTSDAVQSVAGITSVRIDSGEALRSLADWLSTLGRCAAMLFPVQSEDLGNYFRARSDFTVFEAERDDFTPYDCAAMAMHTMHTRWPELSRYRVWFTRNDRMAYGISQAIRAHGLTPGKDFLVAGFDDLECSFRHPFFTTIHPPLEQMAEQSAQLLLERIRNPELPPTETVLRSEVIYRASTGPLPSQPTRRK
ncbi:MAG: LacI family DNA-binding transcriptional regulator [Victivallales bacterium]|nr:LacI family DNA-binding transcriptional regulator [Victivallales bacterium]